MNIVLLLNLGFLIVGRLFNRIVIVGLNLTCHVVVKLISEHFFKLDKFEMDSKLKFLSKEVSNKKF